MDPSKDLCSCQGLQRIAIGGRLTIAGRRMVTFSRNCCANLRRQASPVASSHWCPQAARREKEKAIPTRTSKIVANLRAEDSRDPHGIVLRILGLGKMDARA